MSRLDQAMALNDELVTALARNEPWAVEYAERLEALDGTSSRRFLDREFDGRPRNWCGTCPHKDGCVTCDLPGNHSGIKSMGIGIGSLTNDPVKYLPGRKAKRRR